jgi:hypothetical protein
MKEEILGLAYSLKAGEGGVLVRDNCTGRTIGDVGTTAEARELISQHRALRCSIAEDWAKGAAEHLERACSFQGLVSQFEQERGLPNYKQALDNYSAALWRWAHGKTPVSTLDRLYEDETRLNYPLGTDAIVFGPRVLHATLLHYILHRATFLEGLGHGLRGHWWSRLSQLAQIAYGIRDFEFFDKCFQRPSRSIKGVEERTGRDMKFQLLAAWLPTGMWNARSREEQWCILEDTGWSKRTSETKLVNAQRRLGLHWFRPSSAA